MKCNANSTIIQTNNPHTSEFIVDICVFLRIWWVYVRLECVRMCVWNVCECASGMCVYVSMLACVCVEVKSRQKNQARSIWFERV